jgi:hypothetical protein
VQQGFCPAGTKAQLCLAAGNLYGDPNDLRSLFKTNGWRLFERSWLIAGLQALAGESYENSIASVVAKLLLRDRKAPVDDDDEPATVAGASTRSGFMNPNGQVVVRATGLAGTDRGQSVYELHCSHCDDRYGANGSDIWLRKCPACQRGRPGLPLS